MHHVLHDLITLLETGRRAVLAAVIRSSGSAPRTSGARMLVREDGSLSGSVGGGALEGACLAGARELFRDNRAWTELDFKLDGLSASEEGMICGGAVTVLLHMVEPEELDWYRTIRQEYQQGLRPLIVTLLPVENQPLKMLHLSRQKGDDIEEELRREILSTTNRASFLMHFHNRPLFVEPLVHPGVVHLAGAGHVALFTAQLAAFAGFEVVAIDDRAEFANKERFPQAREVRVIESFADCLGALGGDDYVVIVTRGHLHDRAVLAQALRTDAGYIGMIGSPRKRAAIYTALKNDGFTDADLARVYNPIGLPIGADTPEEIAISIAAELIQVRAGMGA